MADKLHFSLLPALLVLLAAGISPFPLSAASTGTTALHRPQGGGAGTANGDYITASSGGLNTFYRYFIEVPSGVSRLTVEIFDADVGAGGATEDTAGRDRDRGGYDTTATYSLLDPAGTAQTTRFSTGNTTSPTGSDNAWLVFYNASANTVRDNFGTAAYSNNDGTSNWTGSWVETDGGGGGATGGSIQVTGGELRLQDVSSGTQSIYREVDLLGTPGLDLSVAFLTFTYRTSNTLDNSDEIDVEVSGNGGGSWTTLETFANDSSGSRSYDITAFIANNTRIRFVVTGLTSSDEFFYVDNLQIADGLPRTAGHWELRVSQSTGGADIDDINAFGIRAHDGTSGSGGTELNVYYDSHSSFGANPPGSGTTSASYTVYPYVTSGCTASKNDFDFDSNRGNTGSLSLASRTDASTPSPNFTQSYTSSSMSADDAWRRDTFSGWTSDTAADDYGIWEADLTITSYLVGTTPNGNYGHLSFTNSSAVANPPAANPTTNAFRVYLANDAGTAPSKPYLEQLLTHKSGPNPVPVNGTSRYQVTVRLVNPGAQSIIFSASNLVTANVPGSGAVYVGNAAVGQGSIVSQPSVGGTGNITWNPGTVTAGTTTVLTYQVDITPASAGLRVRATGTPASNGTRAQWVDTTGNTTQTRATYLFGPLCELAITQGELLTQAVVSSFRALPGRHGGVLVEWTTASEERTAGFRLLRRDPRTGRFAPAHAGLLPALVGSPQGGTYRFLDEGAWPREPQVYVLEEVEAKGDVRRHGPFRVSPWEETSDAPDVAAGFERTPHPASGPPVQAGREAAGRPEMIRATGRENGTLHVSVGATGLVHLSSSSLAAASGLPLDRIERQIGDGRVTVSRDGLPVAWHPDLRIDKTAAGLFFYGEAPDSLYSAVSVYKVDLGALSNGVLMKVDVLAGKPAGEPGDTFPEVRRSERDVLPATAIGLDPESDYWFWEFLLGDDPTFGVRTFALDAPGVSSAGAAELAMDLQGATTTGVVGEHRVDVRLNGIPLGDAEWQGIAPHRATFAVPPGTLLATGNQVELIARTGGGASHSVTYVEGFDLAYRRSFQAAGGSLTFAPDDGPDSMTVSGFSDPAIRLLDVSDPRSPRWIEGAVVEAETRTSWRLSFTPPAPDARYLAAAAAAVQTPVAIRPWGSVARTTRADYVVITPSSWRSTAEQLAGLRRSQGLASAVFSLEDVADSFGNGVATPQAIRAFLAHAWTWPRRPGYVALAGQGTLDYRNLLGYNDNVLPPLMVQSAGGLFPSDNRLGDVNGDGVPEMAVGRIPVLTAPELQGYVDKVAAYEAGSPAHWARRVLLLSDSPDQGRVFAADSDRVASQSPSSFQVEKIDLGTESLPSARARLLAGLAAGAGLVNYFGHGGLDRLAAGGLLTNADAHGLANGDRLPVLTAMTCTVNRFAVPGVPSLGEVLVQRPGGGAVAVFGPSGLAESRASLGLAEIFYRQTAERGTSRLGDLILRSYIELRAQGGDISLVDIYNLLGDPALRLHAVLDMPAGGGSGGE